MSNQMKLRVKPVRSTVNPGETNMADSPMELTVLKFAKYVYPSCRLSFDAVAK
jgi:hypothetical protein